MPPTYSPWLRPLEWLGRLGFLGRGGPFDGLAVGDPTQQLDALGGAQWRGLAESRALFEAWNPPQSSPWSAYAKPTLFAAIDGYRPFQPRWWRPAPPGPVGLGTHAPHGMEAGAAPRQAPSLAGTAVVLDLPGPESVAWAGWLAARRRAQPVVLFNNWPHSRGLVDASRTLGALLHFGPWAAQDRELREPDLPPAFVLDRGRLGTRKPAPRDFDNRYYHLDSDLPSATVLQRHGIERVLHVGPATGPAPPELDDLNPWLGQVAKRLPVATAVWGPGWSQGPPRPHAPKARPTPFNTTRDPRFAGYRRAAAGGFGALVPEPGSGG
jgi:hypothetical protein